MSGLLTGSIVFAIIGIIASIIISQYVYMRTKDESEGGRYKRENRL